MSDLPIILEIINVNLIESRLTFKAYDLDRTTQTIQGDLNGFIAYLNQAHALRQLGYKHAEYTAECQTLQAMLELQERTLQDKQTTVEKVKVDAQTTVEKVKATHKIPQYDKRVVSTQSSQQRQGGVLAGIAIASFGILIFFSGEGGWGKVMGSTFLLGGSLMTYSAYVTAIDDSSYAQRQRQLKQEAERNTNTIHSAERQAQETVNQVQRDLENHQKQNIRLKEQLQSAQEMVLLAGLMHQFNQAFGDGIVYGEADQIRTLEYWMMQQKTDQEAIAKGLAGAAIVGLMVIGAFTGFGS